MSRIPTSTSVAESAVIEAPFSAVWHLIKLPSFSKFWGALASSEGVSDTSDEAQVVRWKFKDGQEVEVKLEEHSVSAERSEASASAAKRRKLRRVDAQWRMGKRRARAGTAMRREWGKR
jgi:hypothetical protein